MQKIKSTNKAKQAGLTNAIAHKIILEYDDVLNLKQQFSHVLNTQSDNEAMTEAVKDHLFQQSLNHTSANCPLCEENPLKKGSETSCLENSSFSQSFKSCIELHSETSGLNDRNS